jgi:hypothetical protein
MDSDDRYPARRHVLAAAGGVGLTATVPEHAALAQAVSSAPAAHAEIAASITPYLGELQTAVDQIANTWRPNDPQYRADIYRQIMMNLSFAYFVYFHADPEHPDWAPLYNPVYLMQPNPDDIYLYCPLRGDLKYQVSGNCGTVRLLTLGTSFGLPGTVDDISKVTHYHDLDQRDLKVGPDGEFALLISVDKPADYTGNWLRMDPEADTLMVRYRMWDWVKDRDPQLSIVCLNPAPPKRRLTPDEIVERLKLMAGLPGRMAKMFFGLQNAVKQRAGINVFSPERTQGGLSKQLYWPAVFEFDDGEALIIETEMPKIFAYWNIQLNDPYFNAVEYVYRMSSINGSTAKIDSDGKLRAVISLEDPGVPNWLDPAGFKQGTVYGRWYDCDTYPLPVIKRVPLAKLRHHLPKDTPTVTKEQRAAALRERVRAAQRRRRW